MNAEEKKKAREKDSVFPTKLSSYALTLVGEGGLSKRELFAAMMMQGFASSEPMGLSFVHARQAVKWADELILELDKPKEA